MTWLLALLDCALSFWDPPCQSVILVGMEMIDRWVRQSDLSQLICTLLGAGIGHLCFSVSAVYDFKRANYLLLNLSFLIKNMHIDSYTRLLHGMLGGST